MAEFEIFNIAQVAFALFDQIDDKQATEPSMNTNRHISDCPTLRLTQVGTLNHSTTTPFLIKGVALILHHTFNQSLVIIIIINEDS